MDFSFAFCLIFCCYAAAVSYAQNNKPDARSFRYPPLKTNPNRCYARNLTNGRVRPRKPKIGRRVVYSCRLGYELEGEVTSLCTKNGLLPKPPVCIRCTRVGCATNPCDSATCPAYPEAVCKPNPCRPCKYNFFIDEVVKVNCKIERSSARSQSITQSPGLGFEDSCIPCKSSEPICHSERVCERFPDAICHTYKECSCDPLFVLGDKYLTLEDCAQPVDADLTCPKCETDPCGGARCLRYPGAECVSNYCGCDYVFVYKKRAISFPGCNRCSRVGCAIRPCELAVCPGYPDAVCKENKCDACKYNFFLAGKIVDCGRECSRVGCGSNPCETATCSAYPDAKCIEDTCHACRYKFFVDGEEVNCEKQSSSVSPISMETSSECTPCTSIDDICYYGRTCDKYPDAICHTYKECSCDPIFVLNGVYYSLEDCEIPEVEVPKACPLCEAPTCGTCPRHPGAECVIKSCDCKSIFVYEKKVLSFMTCGRCPRMSCLTRPCDTATCPAHPNAVCRENKCIACKYDFFLDGKKVKCALEKCPEMPEELECYKECDSDLQCPGEERCCGKGCNTKCTKGVPSLIQCPSLESVNCIQDPCEHSKCLGQTYTTCVQNYCGGCFADFYNEGVLIPHQKCELPVCRMKCPDDSCADYMCMGYPGRTCVPDTCNGCKPRFYDENGFRLTDQCHGCPNNEDQSDCIDDPCEGKTCRASPLAICKSNYCGGCNYDFYLTGKKVENCDADPPPPCTDFDSYQRPEISDRFYLQPACYNNSDCSDGKNCCFDGKTNLCV